MHNNLSNKIRRTHSQLQNTHAFIPLNKVDIINPKINAISSPIKLKHTRTYSCLPKSTHKHNNSHKQLTLFRNNSLVNQTPTKFHHKQMATQLRKIDRCKISSRSFNKIKAYSANSHPGYFNTTNQDRVLIITNLTKVHDQQTQVSFFAIYDGHNGSTFADCMREHFHHLFLQNQIYLTNVNLAIKTALIKLQRQYNNNPIYSKSHQTVSFVILIFMGDTAYYAQIGQPTLVISKNLAKQLISVKPSLNKLDNSDILVGQIDVNSDIDFIVMEVKESSKQ